jgi:hypothetical protein
MHVLSSLIIVFILAISIPVSLAIADRRDRESRRAVAVIRYITIGFPAVCAVMAMWIGGLLEATLFATASAVGLVMRSPSIDDADNGEKSHLTSAGIALFLAATASFFFVENVGNNFQSWRRDAEVADSIRAEGAKKAANERWLAEKRTAEIHSAKQMEVGDATDALKKTRRKPNETAQAFNSRVTQAFNRWVDAEKAYYGENWQEKYLQAHKVERTDCSQFYGDWIREDAVIRGARIACKLREQTPDPRIPTLDEYLAQPGDEFSEGEVLTEDKWNQLNRDLARSAECNGPCPTPKGGTIILVPDRP